MSDRPADALPRPALEDRPVTLRQDGLTTLRLLHDVPDPDAGKRWFTGAVPAAASDGNLVTALIDGKETFAAIHAALALPRAKGDLIYFAGWECEIDLPLVATDPKSSLRVMLVRAAERGVQVRVLLYRNVLVAGPRATGAQEMRLAEHAAASFGNFLSPDGPTWAVPDGDTKNVQEVDDLNLPGRLYDMAALCDSQGVEQGSHHMKALVVRSGDRLVALLGGVDIVKDRLDKLNDVHCRIEGPAALTLLVRLRERWEQHPKRPPDKAPLEPLLPLPAAARSPAGARQRAQIAFTFADGSKHAFAPGYAPYRFAPHGDKGIWEQVAHAITQARRFIYIENQYFYSKDLTRLLARQLPKLEHLTLLIEAGGGNMPGAFERQRECYRILWAADPTGQKVRVFGRRNWDKAKYPRDYVHSKAWIFDDELAIIGSANAASRSYTCDSEVAAAIWDDGRAERPSWTFARALRVRLWAKHLAMDTPWGHAQLADGVPAADRWLEVPTVYDESTPHLVYRMAPATLDAIIAAKAEDLAQRGKDAAGGYAFDSVLDPWPGEVVLPPP